MRQNSTFEIHQKGNEGNKMQMFNTPQINKHINNQHTINSQSQVNLNLLESNHERNIIKFSNELDNKFNSNLF